MSSPRVLILRAPGTNCDRETAFAFQQAGAQAEIVHINRLHEEPRLPAQSQIFCIPGGFSYGDDIAAGRIVAEQLRHHFLDVLRDFHQQGKLILGICNGFQVLLKSGLLLCPDADTTPATLTWNTSGQFEDRWVNLGVDGERCVFLRDIPSIYLPIAHAEGKFVAADEKLLDNWEKNGQLALRYAEAEATAATSEILPFPLNPNGSQRNVAGICDTTGRIFGLMPHPERFIEHVQHPRWSRIASRPAGQGLQIFENAVKFFQ